MRRTIALTILIFLIIHICVYADDFYFGGMTNQMLRYQNIGINEGGEADSIKEQLGFNLLFGCGPTSQMLVDLGTDQGFYTFPAMTNADGTAGAEFKKLRNGNYAKIEAEDSEHEVRFTYNIGTDTNGFVYGPLDSQSQGEPVAFLSGLTYRHPIYKDENFYFTYELQIVMRPAAGFPVPDSGDPVGFLMLNSDTIKIITYSVADTGISIKANDTPEPPVNKYDNIKIGTYQNCEFGVDWFKVYNTDGSRLYEDSTVYQSVLDFASNYTDSGNVVYWYFHDEPRYTQFMPDGAWRAVFNNNNHHGASVFSRSVGQDAPREYVEYGDPEIFFCDVYPLNGGQICSTFTTVIDYQTGDTLDYYFSDVIQGNKTAYTGYDSTTSGWGLQKILDDHYVDYLDTLYAVAEDNGLDFWVLSQAFKHSYKDLLDTVGVEINESGDTLTMTFNDRDCEDDVAYIWRTPTESELSALTFIAMCYPIKGLVYWRYDSGDSDDARTEGITVYDASGTWIKSDLWDHLRDYISPYVKAYGNIYASDSLNHDRTYKVNDSTDPPSGALIESINSWSDSTNPDSGWFQVGEFHDESGDDYIMLVNRACSKGVNDTTPAPDINVVVHFDTAAFSSDYLYVINLADTAYYNADSSRWVAIPDTTYTAAMPDGTIPFTTILGPGEGRLFKIAGTDEKELSGNIATQYKYQGRIQVEGDITIPAEETMTILGPARFEFYRCDGDSAGIDTNRIEFTINGALKAIGTSLDSIKFVSDTLFNCNMTLSTNPDEGDWYGIVDKSSDYDTLAYCVVQWAIKGYFADSASNALLQHCNISNNDSANIYIYGIDAAEELILESCSIHDAPIGIEMRHGAIVSISKDNSISNNSTMGIYNHESYLKLTNSIVNDNEVYGLNSYNALDSVMSSSFSENGSYGIKIDGSNTSNDESYLHDNSITQYNGEEGSLYGIYISDDDYVTIDSCIVKYYDQGGIKINGCDPLITDCTLIGNEIYGFYCTSSSPEVRYCILDTLGIGVYNFMFGSGIADLGQDSQEEYGYNSFLDCDDYFIYFSGIQFGASVDTLFAERNWWGDSSGPAASMLYVRDTTTMHIEWDPPLFEQPSRKFASQLPLEFSLNQNYPNPFNPNTTIMFSLDKSANTIVNIYNILGQKVATPVDEYLEAGSHSIIWDGRNKSGEKATSGVYFYTIQSGDHFDSKKMLLLR